MKRFALTLLTTAIASTAIAPIAFAAPDFDQLRRENLDKDAVGIEQRRGHQEGLKFEKLDELRRENLDKDAVNIDQLRRENLEKDAVTYPAQ